MPDPDQLPAACVEHIDLHAQYLLGAVDGAANSHAITIAVRAATIDAADLRWLVDFYLSGQRWHSPASRGWRRPAPARPLIKAGADAVNERLGANPATAGGQHIVTPGPAVIEASHVAAAGSCCGRNYPPHLGRWKTGMDSSL